MKNVLNTNESQSPLFQHATIGILITGSKGEIISLNPVAERMFAYRQHELADKKIEILIPVFLRKRHEQPREYYYKHPELRPMGQRSELSGRRKDGTEFPVEITLSPFKNENGFFVITFITDISSRKRQDDILLRTHRELIKKSEALKHINDEMKEFSYISSHHLQEPLRKIQTYSLLLRKEEENISDEGKEYLKKILMYTEIIRSRVEDFTLFTNITGEDQIRLPSDLKLIFEKILDDLDVLIKQEKAKILVLSQLPVIYAAPRQIGKLFFNLLSNAIKFHKPDAEPVIKIYHNLLNKKNNGDDQKIEIIFEDNGIGFDEKLSKEIFHLFPNNPEGQEQRIGLAVSRKICELHGGNLTVQSREGSGTKFTIILMTKIADNIN